jgi:hypothetical protein
LRRIREGKLYWESCWIHGTYVPIAWITLTSPWHYCGQQHGTRNNILWNQVHLDLNPVS